jgi:uncharacterized protein YcnI
MKLFSFGCVPGALAWALALPASAHITLEHQTAHAGSYYKANFRVGHGCGASPIRQIVVHIPEGVQGARPMPKPGWDLSIDRARPASAAGQAVARISWTARTEADRLSSEHYDEFALLAKLPSRSGPLYWSVSQICVDGRIDWSEVPQPGQSLRSLERPAALLDLLPGGHSAHAH